jgi:hypothetical protein
VLREADYEASRLSPFASFCDIGFYGMSSNEYKPPID